MELTAQSIPQPQRISGTGLESVLDFMSRLVLILGVLGSIGYMIFVDAGLMACLLAVAAVLNWLWLRALAELIRLLKRSAGLDYAGRISGSYIDTVPTCSNCGSALRSDVCCNGCGARLIRPDADGSPSGPKVPQQP